MRLLRSWRDSLLLLAPQNFKLFALVTLKSTFETYKVLARVWYLSLIPLITPIAIKLYLISLGPDNALDFFKTTWSYHAGMFVASMQVLLTVMVCLATRPSIKQKNAAYFISYIRSSLMLVFVGTLLKQAYLLWSWVGWNGAFSMQIATHYIPLWIFFILFFLDSDGSIKEFWTSVVRAVKMTVYNLPLLMILIFVVSLVGGVFAKLIVLHRLLAYASLFMYLFLLKPLVINIWTNIYIKKLHEMPDLYFKQPK